MPHFVVDCSPGVLAACPAPRLLAAIHEEAVAAGLFAERDIKVRIRPFEHYSVAGGTGPGAEDDFLHVLAHIMEGRSVEQRQALSARVVRRLLAELPAVPVISMDVVEIGRATYARRDTIDEAGRQA